MQGPTIHVFYHAVDGKSFNSKSFGKLGDIRLHLSNGEQKIPQGGFALFALNADDGQIEVERRRFNVYGWVVVRGIPQVRSANFRMTIDGVSHELYILFRQPKDQIKSLDRNAYRMEFEVRPIELNKKALDLFMDPPMVRKTEGDIDFDDLKALLGGPFTDCEVAIFDAEGGFKLE